MEPPGGTHTTRFYTHTSAILHFHKLRIKSEKLT